MMMTEPQRPPSGAQLGEVGPAPSGGIGGIYEKSAWQADSVKRGRQDVQRGPTSARTCGEGLLLRGRAARKCSEDVRRDVQRGRAPGRAASSESEAPASRTCSLHEAQQPRTSTAAKVAEFHRVLAEGKRKQKVEKEAGRVSQQSAARTTARPAARPTARPAARAASSPPSEGSEGL